MKNLAMQIVFILFFSGCDYLQQIEDEKRAKEFSREEKREKIRVEKAKVAIEANMKTDVRNCWSFAKTNFKYVDIEEQVSGFILEATHEDEWKTIWGDTITEDSVYRIRYNRKGKSSKCLSTKHDKY